MGEPTLRTISASPTGPNKWNWKNLATPITDAIGDYRRKMVIKKLVRCFRIFTFESQPDEKKLKALDYVERVFNAYPDVNTKNSERPMRRYVITILGEAIREPCSSACFAKGHELLRNWLPALPADWQSVLYNAVNLHPSPVGKAAALATYYKVNASRNKYDDVFASDFVNGCKTLDKEGQTSLMMSLENETARNPVLTELLLKAAHNMAVLGKSCDYKNDITREQALFLIELSGNIGQPENVQLISDIRHAFMSTMERDQLPGDREVVLACVHATENILAGHQKKR
jgi:hypothetical protein